MDTSLKLQDPRTTARWHNIWLRTAIFFLASTVTFSALFGWSVTKWKDDDNCHEYYASLTHIPYTNDSFPTALLFHKGELHFQKGVTYDESSCEGKLVKKLIAKGNVLDIQEGRGRRLTDIDLGSNVASDIRHVTAAYHISKTCLCAKGEAFATFNIIESPKWKANRGTALCRFNKINQVAVYRAYFSAQTIDTYNDHFVLCGSGWINLNVYNGGHWYTCHT